MNDKVLKNKIRITTVFNSPEKQYAFGIILNDDLLPAYIPHTIVNAFELTDEDINNEFFCLYRAGNTKNKLVLALSEDPFVLQPSVEASAQ